MTQLYKVKAHVAEERTYEVVANSIEEAELAVLSDAEEFVDELPYTTEEAMASDVTAFPADEELETV